MYNSYFVIISAYRNRVTLGWNFHKRCSTHEEENWSQSMLTVSRYAHSITLCSSTYYSQRQTLCLRALPYMFFFFLPTHYVTVSHNINSMNIKWLTCIGWTVSCCLYSYKLSINCNIPGGNILLSMIIYSINSNILNQL